MMQALHDSKHKLWRGLNTALTCLIISAPLFLIQIFSAGTTGDDTLPVSIRATSQADYSQDSQAFSIPPINGNIFNQIIANDPAADSAQNRMATLQAELSSPVPTMTSNVPPLTVTPTPTLLLQMPIDTVISPTIAVSATPLATGTPRVTSTPIVAASPTPVLPLPTLPPLLPTLPPLLPTLPPLLPTLPPLLPTLPPLLPTLQPLLPTIPPLLPTIPPLFP